MMLLIASHRLTVFRASRGRWSSPPAASRMAAGVAVWIVDSSSIGFDFPDQRSTIMPGLRSRGQTDGGSRRLMSLDPGWTERFTHDYCCRYRSSHKSTAANRA
jgi:hypothetical protein